jgi:hypothetical protein
MGAVDKGLCEIEFAAIAQILGKRAQHPREHTVLRPGLEPSVTRSRRRIATWQVSPRGARPQDPQNAVHDVAWIAPGPSALGAARLTLLPRKGILDRVPLLVGEVHPHL